MRLIRCFAMLLPLFVVVHSADAALLFISGNFQSGTFDRTVNPDPFIGSWSFQFDDSVVVGSGLETFHDLSMLSFSVTGGVVGATAFDASNTLGSVAFLDGSLTGVQINGQPNGENVVSNTDDFRVVYPTPTGGVSTILVSNVGVAGIATASGNSGSFSSAQGVPEPGSWLLLGTVAAFGFCRTYRHRRKKRQHSL